MFISLALWAQITLSIFTAGTMFYSYSPLRDHLDVNVALGQSGKHLSGRAHHMAHLPTDQ